MVSISWILANGPVPTGLVVMHTCDNPLCVRPDHLSVGTVQDNSTDMTKKDRAAKGEQSGHHIHPERTARGERNGSAVIREADVQYIRKEHLARQATVKSLSKQFGVTETNIRNILAKKTWKYLEVSENERI